MISRVVVATIVVVLLNSTVNADLVVLNEYNAVGSDRFLEADTGSDKADETFGRIVGNGGNWFELAVVGSASSAVVDMRGWSINWTEDDGDGPGGTASAGTITFSDDTIWSNVLRGTLITLTETNDGGGQLATGFTGTDTSFDPGSGDWHINVATLDEVGVGGLVSTTTNVVGDGAGNFSVGNDDWQMTIFDDVGNMVHGPIGEGIGNLGGVNSREVGKLEGPGAGATLADWLAVDALTAPYEDGTSSTWGSANVYSGGSQTQDFSSLRSVPEPNALLILSALSMLGVASPRRR
ncbi:hypothetical protein [Mariniblastus fucicola]|uniref:PEP-CTERM protein-sorting domain-containing protein n=1 Tax=Mariniblastus fucicola TaxID=980251 RepID=A0A5B9PKL6_9BACT|nr:hypothetical protein [Mariniblastus fucicola]QEG25246.1 hypothetical protein MFFC18_51700 [Mariniblastus fucicola]